MKNIVPFFGKEKKPFDKKFSFRKVKLSLQIASDFKKRNSRCEPFVKRCRIQKASQLDGYSMNLSYLLVGLNSRRW